MTETLLSPRQVAARLGCHRSSVYRWLELGLLPSVRTPGGMLRIVAAELDAVLQRERPPEARLRIVAPMAQEAFGRSRLAAEELEESRS